MALLITWIDHDAAHLATIAAHNADLAGPLHRRTAKAVLGGSATYRERHVAFGKLLPCDWVHRFIDPGAPFLKIGQLAAGGMYDDDGGPAGAGVIGGISRVRGRKYIIAANDPTVKGGA